MRKKYLIWLLPIAVAAFFLFDGPQLLSLDNIREHRQALADFTDRHYLLMLIACGIGYSLSTALSLPGGTVLSLLLGLLFGRWMGTLLIVISATLGATALFWLARYLLSDWAEQRLRSNTLAKKLLDGFQADAFNYLLFLRLVPAFPFWLVNLAPAFTPVSLRIYVMTTFIGIIPGSFVFANLGQSLGSIQRLDQLLSTQTLLAFSLLGVLSLLPVWLKYRTND
ncbi:TVP38/TMEM64 family protein [Methylobacter tundripaludum]|uniref:SNARE associated protein n=1 Tax=Methylobacter tundripaludum (strain ATCC BAA-1195 / DSM 17260 / SV96) TaxID=697282 RepID=G3J0Y5_METTV|nr:TVP38/TMEM64 family protein [Methylobacter tundripaludum]EGW20857.1 SNARE associated protein [Methylobacter tundripaludum SV96]